MITSKQVTVKQNKVGDWIAQAGMVLGYGRTKKEAISRIASNLSWRGIGHSL